ncbi:MAG: ABC transporter ATP-binding protein [Marinobacter sp.]|nr:ABC transporter ATP-binding protein [Marinobacter sp.]
MSDFLTIDNLHVAFGDTDVVSGLSFSLEPGKTLALVGESGSGKSVSALSILRLINSAQIRYPSGKILFRGEDLLRVPEKRLRQIRGSRISMIFQEPMTSLNPLHTVERQITEILSIHRGMRGPQARARCLELLDMVGIPSPAEKLASYPHQLSGGQKQRVMIAMALANEPELLVADEPTTALDVTVQQQVLELIQELQRKHHMAALLITHDLNIVRRYADQVVVMEKGQLVEAADTETLFEHPQQPYTRQLLDAMPHDQPPALVGNRHELLSVDNLQVRFPLKRNLFGKVTSAFHAVAGATFRLGKGETLGIVGESGSGKTTIGHALLKLIESQGQVSLDGIRLDGLNQRQFRPYRRRIQIVFQDPFGSLSPRMSVGDIVGEGLGIHFPADQAQHEQRIIKALRDVGLDPDTRHRYPHEFSGGQRQRIAIARALVLQPELIILDEPTSALDRTVQKQVVELLRNLQQQYGLSYVFISHDLAVVKALSHHLLVLKQGQVVEYGPAEQVFEAPQALYTQQLLEAAFFYHR